MAEYIDREALLATIKREIDQSNSSHYCCEDGTIISTDVGYVEDWFDEYAEVLMRSHPAADVVEVVRCKDCKHRHSSEFCECREPDAFCSDGEKKETE